MRIDGKWSSVALLIAGFFVCGCRGTARVSGESSKLRAEIVELQDRITQLELRNRELEAEIQAASTTPQSLPEDIRANIPQVAEIEVQRLSFARDKNGDGQADHLTLYITSRDGRGRFTQLTGELSAAAMLLPVEAEPSVIGHAALTPGQVRDAYRSSVTGTHYTIEVPLEQAPPASSTGGSREIFARVQYRDGITGKSLTAERKIPLP